MDRVWPAEVPAPGYEKLAAHAPQQPAPAAHSVHPRDAPTPPRVLIVGGSMGGCCAALALGEVGCRVSVVERAAGDLKAAGAGLVVQPDMADFLLRYKVTDHVEDVCVKSAGRQYVDAGGAVLGGDDNPQLFSAWDVLHRAIKGRVPPDAYHSSSTVTGLSSLPDGVSVTLQGEQRFTGDLLVGCDGPGSLVRRTFLPEVKSEYQGYVAWRGLAPEADLPPGVLEFMRNKFTVQQMSRSHILAYVIPGADGSTQPGRRRVNWVWYTNCKEEELPALLRDVHGHQHLYSVPRGLLRPEVAAERRRAALEVLAPVLADLVFQTREIFIQAIHDMHSPTLVLTHNCCLLGDSGCILRPHTAAGTTKAAVNAMALAACLQHNNFQLQPALREYDASQQQLAEYLVEVGRRIGTQSQFPERRRRHSGA